jgi:hypothetical protein
MAGKGGAGGDSTAPHRSVHAAIGLVQAGRVRGVACDGESLSRRCRGLGTPSARRVSRAGRQAWVRADTLVLSLNGDWSVGGEGSHARTPERLMEGPDEPQSAGAIRAHIGVVERVGDWAIARWSDGAAFATLAGEAVLRAAPALRGKVRTRAGDLLNLIYGMSAAALPMVALLNVLVGALVALVVSSAWARDAAPRTSAAQRPRLR